MYWMMCHNISHIMFAAHLMCELSRSHSSSGIERVLSQTIFFFILTPFVFRIFKQNHNEKICFPVPFLITCFDYQLFT